MKEKRNDDRLSVRELAEVLRVSTDTIRRAYRKGQIPAIRVRTALRFNLDEVLGCLQRKPARLIDGTRRGAPGGESRTRTPQNALEQVKRRRNF